MSIRKCLLEVQLLVGMANTVVANNWSMEMGMKMVLMLLSLLLFSYSLRHHGCQKSGAFVIFAVRWSFSRQFRNSEGTAEFVKRFNKLFDIFNSDERNQDSVFKSLINATSKEEIVHFLDDMVDYIQHLSWNEKPLIESQKNTAFLGFCSNITALKLIYEEIVEKGLKLTASGPDLCTLFMHKIY